MYRKFLFFALSVFLINACSDDDPGAPEMETAIIASATFEQALINIGVDADGTLNGSISNSDISEITSLALSDQNIRDLSGIENFTGLIKLEANNNQLTSLDVSQNTALRELDFHNNMVTTINVRQNIALTSLVCFDNQLTSLDVRQNSALATLACTNNRLTALDVRQNTNLTQLYCSENQLTALDVSQNSILEELFCFSNQLTLLDVSKNTALTELYPYDNLLTRLNVQNGNNSILTKLNATANNDLLCIQVDNERIANEGQAPYNVWIVDAVSTYSENCAIP